MEKVALVLLVPLVRLGQQEQPLLVPPVHPALARLAQPVLLSPAQLVPLEQPSLALLVQPGRL